MLVHSPWPGDALRGRYEWSDGTRSDGPVVIHVNSEPLPIGSEDRAQASACVRRIRRDEQSVAGQSR